MGLRSKTRVSGASKIGEGGGQEGEKEKEDISPWQDEQTNNKQQGKIELLSHWILEG